MDGVYNALFAHNLAKNVGGFWTPQTADYMHPSYWDNPQLSAYFLSLWYKFFGDYYWVEKLYSLFSPICHQYPTRCFWVFERPWALCARCASGYLGIAVAAAFSKLQFPFWKRSLIGLLLIGLAAIDPLLQLFGFYESNNILRLITGFIGGYGAFLFVYPLPLKYKEQAL